ncbi:TRAP transporter substrate-binding protein [Oceanithermus sp.]
MKKITTLVFSALLLAGLGMAKTKWDMHVAWPPSNFHTKGVVKFADLVAQKTGGQLEIVVHPGGALGFKGQEVLGAVRSGTLPIAELFMGNARGDDPIFGLTSVPLLVKNYDEAWKLYQIAKPYYEKALDRQNAKLLYAVPWPPSGIYTKNLLRSTADFKGLKIRTYDANSAEFVTLLGGQGIAIPFSELYTALSTGLVNGVLTSTQTGVDAKLWEVTNYFHRINYAFPLNMVIVNKQDFEKLPADEQKAILDAAAEVEAYQWKESKKADLASEIALKTHGMKVITNITPELQSAMEDAAQKILAKWLQEAGPTGEEIIKAFRGK